MKKNAEQALHLLAAYCSRAERCEQDLRKKMKTWEIPDDEQKKIIERLVKEKFLNEERFCRSFVNDKFKYNKWGTNKIVFELRKKNIPESVYKSVLEDLELTDVKEQLTLILKQKNKTIKYKDNYDRKTKLIRFAIGRGFDMGMTVSVVNNMVEGDDFEAYY